MIELINVSKKFKDKIVFNNINLKIDKPGIYSFVGDNGTGKSTLLNIINGSVKINKGKVVNKIKATSFVSQSVNLIEHLTIREHFDMFNLNYNLLKRFGLFYKLDSYPKELSFGQRQRVGCIIGIYSNSSLLILDEPTSHLDNKNSILIMREVKKISKYKIVILVSHSEDIVNEYSDVIYRIDNRNLNLIKNGYFNDEKIIQKKNKFSFKKYIKRSIRFYKKINFVFCVIIVILSFMLLVTNGVSYNFDKLIEEEIKYSLDYNKFYLKECMSEYKGNILVKKCDNLSQDKINVLKENNKVGYNYDLLMNTLYNTSKFNVISSNNIELKEGRYPLSYNEIISNDSHRIGDVINLKAKEIVQFDKTDIYTNNLDLVVVGTISNKHLFNEDKYYLDYDLLESYLKEEMLINNGIDLYSYYKWLEVENYKYVLYFDDIDLKILEDNNVEYLSSSYEYYESLTDISREINNCFKYLNYIVIPCCLYYFIRLVSKKIKFKDQEIDFLMCNGIRKKRIIKLINKEQNRLVGVCYLASALLVQFILYVIFKEIYINYSGLFLNLLFVLIINSLLTKMVFKRRRRVC